QLEQLAREANPQMAAPAAPRPSRPPPGEPPRPAPAPSFTLGADAEARAAQFLAEANQRQALEDAARGGPAAAPTTGLRELSEPARAARAIVEHRHQNLVEANAL